MPFTSADANRVAFKYLKEVTYGTTPGTALKLMRYNSHNVGMKSSFITSNEIRSDRQRSDTILVSQTSDGDVQHEWSYGAADDLIEGAMQSTFAAALTFTAITISAASADNSLNTSGAFPVFIVGSWIKVTGFTTNGATFFAKVVSRTATKVVVSGITLVVEAAGASVTTANAGNIRNGSTATSFTLESEFAFSDATTTFLNHKGMRVSTMGINVGSSQIVTGSFGFMGLGTLSSATTVGTGADVAAPTNSVMGEANVGAVYEGGVVATTVSFKSINMTLNNNLRAQDFIGSTFPGGIGAGTVDVTATIQAYFSNATFYSKFVNNTPTSLAFTLVGTDGGSYLVELPRVRITSATIVPPGVNTDVMIDGTVTAYRDPTNGYTVQITRFL